MSARRTFGPAVLLGLVGAVLGAVAATKVWVAVDTRTDLPMLVGSDLGTVPLAAALGYVLLAGWAVLLVTRGTVRRAFAVICLVVSLGVAAAVVWAPTSLPDDVRDRYPGGSNVGTHLTGWYWAAAVAAVLAVVGAALAVRFVGHWPQMGRRYDAPAGTREEVATADPSDPDDGIAVWKAQDEGRDPTDPAGSIDPTEPTGRPGKDSGH